MPGIACSLTCSAVSTLPSPSPHPFTRMFQSWAASPHFQARCTVPPAPLYLHSSAVQR
ncbi:hypothetical protein PF005_g17124 [Phytophthora fragariae]|uniref:Uncharacterized protein n=1 Tax=Phytophthora fragariae TaxID=53985 RepID=A0A6A3X3F1_9STRA|nr:hypothetical protein PF003_g30107 [Phytophthora fragariae]KAE8932387.1 hypothetical protein PF009_g17580 [Phytophthora fragariae]KAE8998244.1 hypothetical protein PF011_g15137 [Phytophthora fragariae]KAE9096765.1 hypothetical protein PF010_g16217 [Phytophthora fragariae]KAE9100407.1 hypothetical protein PF007_g15522 [Phytophthora fragariae]